MESGVLWFRGTNLSLINPFCVFPHLSIGGSSSTTDGSSSAILNPQEKKKRKAKQNGGSPDGETTRFTSRHHCSCSDTESSTAEKHVRDVCRQSTGSNRSQIFKNRKVSRGERSNGASVFLSGHKNWLPKTIKIPDSNW